MLQTQRLLHFTSRVHTYCVLLILFFFFAYLAGCCFSVEQQFASLLVLLISILSWTVYLVAVWMFMQQLLLLFHDHTFSWSVMCLTVVRVVATFLISYTVEMIERAVTEGIVIGW